jgi:4-coumarate--CoA ligase
MTVYKSPWGELKEPYYGNLAQFLRDSSKIQANLNKKLLIDASTGESLSGAQLLDLSARFSFLLREKYGIQTNDVVALFTANSIYTPVLHLGILSRGAIVSPANTGYTVKELKHQLVISQSKLVITGSSLRNVAELAAENTKTAHVVSLEQLIMDIKVTKQSEHPVPFPGHSSKERHAYYLFSSGTSGLPKCTIISHYNISANVQQQLQSGHEFYETDATYGAVLPMSHSYGMSKFVFVTLYNGSTTVVLEKYNLEVLLRSICNYEITALHLVPPMVVQMLKSPLLKNYPVGQYLRKISSGAAPLGGEIMRAAEDKLGASVRQTYGLTETGPIVSSFQWDSTLYQPSSIGWLVPSCEARLINEEGKDSEPGARGELWLRGPNIFLGYLRNPEADAQIFSSDGWLKTGDIAQIDEHGQIYIVDRAKELIKSKGHQVAPAELEALLLTHPSVADCAVTGYYVADDATELPRAFVVLRGQEDPVDIKRWFDKKVSRHKRLWGGIVVLDRIPKGASGKILRRHLRERKNDAAVGYPQPKL